MSQPQAQPRSHPVLINLPPPSDPAEASDNPEMPGTPTSTTTSLSALSTTAIKDGQRGHLPANQLPHTRLSLEAERADRISRLAGLERISALRSHPDSSGSPSAYPAGVGAQLGLGMTPAYFDAQGQPAALTKMSATGTASATGSYFSRATGERDDDDDDDGRTTTADEEDLLSLEGNRGDIRSVASHGDMMSHGDIMSHDGRSGVFFYGDGMSREGDEGSEGDASLVAFGEGAGGSTTSGPIYRRHGPEGAPADTPVSGAAAAAAAQERKAARMTNGVVVDGPREGGEEGFVDTTTREPVVVSPRRDRGENT